MQLTTKPQFKSGRSHHASLLKWAATQGINLSSQGVLIPFKTLIDNRRRLVKVFYKKTRRFAK
jgi:hypothetical protein